MGQMWRRGKEEAPSFPLLPAVSKRSNETLDNLEAAGIRLNKHLSHCSLKNEFSEYRVDMAMTHQFYNPVCLMMQVRQCDLWSSLACNSR